MMIDKTNYGTQTDHGIELLDLRTLNSIRVNIQNFNSGKNTGLDFSSTSKSALERLAEYKLINSPPYSMRFHLDGCSSSAYRYDEIHAVYEKLWNEKGILLPSAETLVSADSAVIRCRKGIPKNRGNPKLFPSVNWERVGKEFSHDAELEQFAFSIATIGNFMPVPEDEQFLLGKLGERFDKELRLIRAYYLPTDSLDMKDIFSDEIQKWLNMFCRNFPNRDFNDWKYFADSNYLKGSFVSETYEVTAFDGTLTQLSRMILNRGEQMFKNL